MYILPQLCRPTSAPAHWLTRLSALSLQQQRHKDIMCTTCHRTGFSMMFKRNSVSPLIYFVCSEWRIHSMMLPACPRRVLSCPVLVGMWAPLLAVNLGLLRRNQQAALAIPSSSPNCGSNSVGKERLQILSNNNFIRFAKMKQSTITKNV